MSYEEIPDITLRMIINAGIIKVGASVYSPDNIIEGILGKEGTITLNLEEKIETFPFPSGAARAITKTSVNGWKYWHILENGKYNTLSHYKELYKGKKA